MKTVTNGNNVTVHYKGTFPDGEVFDDSRARGKPMQVIVGQGSLIKGFETALMGMTEGQSKTFSLTADQAYGMPTPEAITTVPRNAFPEDYNFEEGTQVQGQSPSGQVVLAKIVSFNDEGVVLDHNHPLAGKDLNFEIELLEIEETTDIGE
tara:strand:- start:594 stop:1046 length:453 start_codon:yes stop_codon:yes gene_type:complete